MLAMIILVILWMLIIFGVSIWNNTYGRWNGTLGHWTTEWVVEDFQPFEAENQTLPNMWTFRLHNKECYMDTYRFASGRGEHKMMVMTDRDIHSPMVYAVGNCKTEAKALRKIRRYLRKYLVKQNKKAVAERKEYEKAHARELFLAKYPKAVALDKHIDTW